MTTHQTERVCWWAGEDAVRLSILGRFVPQRASGKPITVRAVYHWAIHGIGGIKLRRFRCGGAWCTTKQEFARWQVALTEAGR